jgi:hypothetical protein
MSLMPDALLTAVALGVAGVVGAMVVVVISTDSLARRRTMAAPDRLGAGPGIEARNLWLTAG